MGIITRQQIAKHLLKYRQCLVQHYLENTTRVYANKACVYQLKKVDMFKIA